MKAPAPAGIATLIAYIATIPAANMAVTHFGAVPVGLGYVAPAGVYLVGLALVLRDLAREATGRGAILAAIAIGTVLSYLLADPSLATASAVAFAVAETMDFVVYEPCASEDYSSPYSPRTPSDFSPTVSCSSTLPSAPSVTCLDRSSAKRG